MRRGYSGRRAQVCFENPLKVLVAILEGIENSPSFSLDWWWSRDSLELTDAFRQCGMILASSRSPGTRLCTCGRIRETREFDQENIAPTSFCAEGRPALSGAGAGREEFRDGRRRGTHPRSFFLFSTLKTRVGRYTRL